MKILAIDHVQLAMPPGEEPKARHFYVGVFELVEIPKPEPIAKRGGLWFEQAALKIHLGWSKISGRLRKHILHWSLKDWRN